MSEIKTTTYVRYLSPGSFFPEESSAAVSERDPRRIAAEAGSGVFAFAFYDVVTTTATAGGDEVRLSSKPLRESGLYYIDAEPLTAYQVGELPGDHSILLSNMRSNGWDTILRCRTGNFRPLEDGDEIVSSGGTP